MRSHREVMGSHGFPWSLSMNIHGSIRIVKFAEWSRLYSVCWLGDGQPKMLDGLETHAKCIRLSSKVIKFTVLCTF
jgi:hypothetical protein